jgi:hypothetical protein
MYSSDPLLNPHFYSWSKAIVMYCDGGSFSGNRAEPYKTSSGKLLYFRGKNILEATIQSLLGSGLSTATHAIFAGASAGGLAMYAHADYIHQRLPPNLDMVVLADSGMFLDLPEWTGAPGYQDHYKRIVEMQNASALNDQCLQHYRDEHWRCFMAPYVVPFIQTPLFIVQALYDSWQTFNIIGVGDPASGDSCDMMCVLRASQIPGVPQIPDTCDSNLTCTDQHEAWMNMAVQMQDALQRAPPGSGVFATPCVKHISINDDSIWNDMTVDGIGMSDAFAKWWRTRADTRLIDNRTLGSNPCPGSAQIVQSFIDYN